MSDQPKSVRSSLSVPRKLMAISAISLPFSFGLCVLFMWSRGVSQVLAWVGMVWFGLSLLGIVVSVLWFVAVAMVGLFRRLST
jgi:hypothetical protein